MTTRKEAMTAGTDDAAVIGSGVNGLVAAAEPALAGWRVAIIDGQGACAGVAGEVGDASAFSPVREITCTALWAGKRNISWPAYTPGSGAVNCTRTWHVSPTPRVGSAGASTVPAQPSPVRRNPWPVWLTTSADPTATSSGEELLKLRKLSYSRVKWMWF